MKFNQKRIKTSREEYIMWTCFKFSPMKNICWKLQANESLIMASLQFYVDILLLTMFLWVNSSDVYYLFWQSKCPNLKTTCHIKLSFFLSTELLENLLLPKCLISVDVALIKLNFYYELTWNEMNTNIWEWFLFHVISQRKRHQLVLYQVHNELTLSCFIKQGKPWNYNRYGSRTIAPEENCPPNPKTNPNLNPNPDQVAIVWFLPHPKTNPILDWNPNPNPGAIFLGGNCPDTNIYNSLVLQLHGWTKYQNLLIISSPYLKELRNHDG